MSDISTDAVTYFLLQIHFYINKMSKWQSWLWRVLFIKPPPFLWGLWFSSESLLLQEPVCKCSLGRIWSTSLEQLDCLFMDFHLPLYWSGVIIKTDVSIIFQAACNKNKSRPYSTESFPKSVCISTFPTQTRIGVWRQATADERDDIRLTGHGLDCGATREISRRTFTSDPQVKTSTYPIKIALHLQYSLTQTSVQTTMFPRGRILRTSVVPWLSPVAPPAGWHFEMPWQQSDGLHPTAVICCRHALSLQTLVIVIFF